MPFTVAACFTLGGVTNETRLLLSKSAKAAKVEVNDIAEQFSVQVQSGNARIVAEALKAALLAPT